MAQKANTTVKAACSVTQMAMMVRLSRARFYELMQDGVFLPPQYTTKTRRPFFTRDAQEVNVAVRRDQLGVNGEYVLFYERAEVTDKGVKKQADRSASKSKDDLLASLVSQLKGLGLSSVTTADVAKAVHDCFPESVPEGQEAEVLRSVYRYLRRSSDV